jgi:hypothetical protein
MERDKRSSSRSDFQSCDQNGNRLVKWGWLTTTCFYFLQVFKRGWLTSLVHSFSFLHVGSTTNREYPPSTVLFDRYSNVRVTESVEGPGRVESMKRSAVDQQGLYVCIFLCHEACLRRWNLERSVFRSGYREIEPLGNSREFILPNELWAIWECIPLDGCIYYVGYLCLSI